MAIPSGFMQASAHEACCHWSDAGGKARWLASSKNGTAADCGAQCLRDEACSFFSHSTKHRSCMLCSACQLAGTGVGRYTSWQHSERAAAANVSLRLRHATARSIAPVEMAASKTAVCVCGAMRSMLESNVRNSAPLLLDRVHSEMAVYFYFLFIGNELSAKGQLGVSTSQASALALALDRAARVRLQLTENAYTCDQKSTGRFFKLAQCVAMVRDYGRESGTPFGALVLSRPDLVHFRPVPMPAASSLAAAARAGEPSPGEPWIVTVGQEVQAMSAAVGLALVANLSQAECCNVATRTPHACFLPGLPEPRAQFIFERHFSSLRRRGGVSNAESRSYYEIALTSEQRCAYRRLRTIHAKHAATRLGVPTTSDDAVRMSPVLQWESMEASERVRALERWLLPPRELAHNVSREESCDQQAVTVPALSMARSSSPPPLPRPRVVASATPPPQKFCSAASSSAAAAVRRRTNHSLPLVVFIAGIEGGGHNLFQELLSGVRGARRGGKQAYDHQSFFRPFNASNAAFFS